MKKISTMLLGLILTAAVFAADKRPDVTIISMKKYEFIIDGRAYVSNSRVLNIENLRNGRHTIQVFEMKRGFSIFKRKQLVASKTFLLRNNDVKITVDRFGHLTITEEKPDHGYHKGMDKKNRDEKEYRDNKGKRF